LKLLFKSTITLGDILDKNKFHKDPSYLYSIQLNLFLLVFMLATFCWTKSLLCNVAAFHRDAALSRVYSLAMFFEKIL